MSMKSTGDQVGFSWSQLWSYYKSSLCSQEQREFILGSFSMKDALEVATPKIQLEILEDAPDDIKRLPEIQDILAPDVKRKLGLDNLVSVEQQKLAENKLKGFFK